MGRNCQLPVVQWRKASRRLLIFINLILLLCSFILSVNSVDSFSNYYAKVHRSSLRNNKIDSSPLPVFRPENVLNDVVNYSSKPKTSHEKVHKKLRNKIDSETSTHEHSYEEAGNGWKKEKEVDNTLDGLTNVLGPGLFLLPFVLKILPFAIPALPISYVLSRYEPGNFTEIFNRVLELATQLGELLQISSTAATEEGRIR